MLPFTRGDMTEPSLQLAPVNVNIQIKKIERGTDSTTTKNEVQISIGREVGLLIQKIKRYLRFNQEIMNGNILQGICQKTGYVVQVGKKDVARCTKSNGVYKTWRTDFTNVGVGIDYVLSGQARPALLQVT